MSHARARKKYASTQYKQKQNYGAELHKHPFQLHQRHLHDAEWSNTQRAIFIGLMLMTLGGVASAQYNYVQFSSKPHNPMTTKTAFDAEVKFLGQSKSTDRASMQASLEQDDVVISTSCEKVYGTQDSCRIEAKNTGDSMALRSMPSSTTASRDGFGAYCDVPTSTVTHYESCFNNGDIINFHESLPDAFTEVSLIEKPNPMESEHHLIHVGTTPEGKTRIDVDVKPDGNIKLKMQTNEESREFGVKVPTDKAVQITAFTQGSATIVQTQTGSNPKSTIEFPAADPGCKCVKDASGTGCVTTSVDKPATVKTFGFFANINEKESLTEFTTEKTTVQTKRKRHF